MVQPTLKSKTCSADTFRRFLLDMVTLQDGHNQEVHPKWIEQGYPFHRAIWTECAELLDHYGWKWWKHQLPDISQTKLEVVDIWHFGLSMIITQETDLDELAQLMVECETTSQASSEQLHSCVETLAIHALQNKFDVIAFVDLLKAIGLSLEELYGLYIGKNVLNRFRQANGYKEGTYQKTWNGQEDNVHLTRIVQEMDPFAVGFASALHRKLQQDYETANKT